MLLNILHVCAAAGDKYSVYNLCTWLCSLCRVGLVAANKIQYIKKAYQCSKHNPADNLCGVGRPIFFMLTTLLGGRFMGF